MEKSFSVTGNAQLEWIKDCPAFGFLVSLGESETKPMKQ
jgi:hypothetical protein